MMILPPDELIQYLSTGENGEWIHSPDMPVELIELFNKFVDDEQQARLELRNMK